MERLRAHEVLRLLKRSEGYEQGRIFNQSPLDEIISSYIRSYDGFIFEVSMSSSRTSICDIDFEYISYGFNMHYRGEAMYVHMQSLELQAAYEFCKQQHSKVLGLEGPSIAAAIRTEGENKARELLKR
jgi:hypothetical protein